jgi:hypothetical protein
MTVKQYKILKSDGTYVKLVGDTGIDCLYCTVFAANRKARFLGLTSFAIEMVEETPVIESWTVQVKTADGEVLTLEDVPEDAARQIDEAIEFTNPVTWKDGE